MISEVRELLDRYADWVRDKSLIRAIEQEQVELTTPYLDRHNDYIQIYVKRENNGFLLHDGGDTILDLRSSGCDLDTEKRKNLLNATLNGFGIQQDGDDLLVKATSQDFPLRKHNLIQAILAVNDLFYLAQPIVASLFLEDVIQWLNLNDIRYTPRVKFTGRSGYDHNFDFVIPSSKSAPERLLRAITRPGRDMAEALAFSWVDTRDVRSEDSQFYAFLNDEHRPPPGDIVDALKSYEIKPIIWSQREEFSGLLAA